MPEEDIQWTAALRMLVNAGVVDDSLFGIVATLPQFASLLRDGVLLCRLVNELDENAISPVEIHNPRGQISDFSCEHNIALFISALEKAPFCIEEQLLFAPSDLAKYEDFEKVLKTLSALSTLDVCRERNIKPFHIREHSTQRHDSVYLSLKDDLDEVENHYYGDHYGQYSYAKTGRYERIYTNLIGRIDSQKRLERTDVWATFKPTTKLDYPIKELLDTEQNYFEKVLSKIVDNYHDPLEHDLSPEESKIIFMNITKLWSLHQNFLADLRPTVYNTLGLSTSNLRLSSISPTIGDVFLKYRDEFTLYGTYCSELDEATGYIGSLEKNNKAAHQKLQDCTSADAKDGNKFSLPDMLAMPFQRFCKYKLMLVEIMKNTAPGSLDYKRLEEAKDAMNDVAIYVNTMKSDYEDQRKTMDIQRSITELTMPEGHSLLSYGKLRVDAEMKVAEITIDKKSEKSTTRHVFAFDKVILICETKAKKSNTYKFKNAYALIDFKPELKANSTDHQSTLARALRTQHYCVHLKRKQGGFRPTEVTDIRMSFKNERLQTTWFQELEKARDNEYPFAVRSENTQNNTRGGQKHQTQYTTFNLEDGKVPKCNHCDRFLGGLYFQGYSCQMCGKQFHKDCLRKNFCNGRRASAYNNESENQPVGGSPIRRGVSSPGPGRRGRHHHSDIKLPVVAPDPPAANPFDSDDIKQHPAYLGELERPESESKLRGTASGTFFIRFSRNCNRFVISVSCYDEGKRNSIKQLKIETTSKGRCYLDEARKFDGIVDLIEYYTENSLVEVFKEVQTKLTTVRQSEQFYRAKDSFHAPNESFLSIKKDDIIELLTKTGEENGWWHGKLNGKVGFFPLEYVEKQESPENSIEEIVHI